MSSRARPSARRQDLIDSLVRAARRSSTSAVMFHGAVAERFGLSASDNKALEILDRAGPLTATELATQTGLAKTSITSLVDRLARKRLVRRVRDPKDRRSIIIQLNPSALAPRNAAYETIRRKTIAALARYTNDELALITEFLTRGADLAIEATIAVGSLASRTRFGARQD
ncbi:MarR family transcriptional regulator [Pendulispora brunnea]|uniref:MarR family transcriptional regulator n=1 Tax=Pendulispora brunnea TaxID=2905690 RepID=A0ABZ2KRH6_9BACT